MISDSLTITLPHCRPYLLTKLSLVNAGDSPAHQSSVAADDEDSLGYAEKLVKGLIPGSESEEDLTSIISPRLDS